MSKKSYRNVFQYFFRYSCSGLLSRHFDPFANLSKHRQNVFVTVAGQLTGSSVSCRMNTAGQWTDHPLSETKQRTTQTPDSYSNCLLCSVSEHTDQGQGRGQVFVKKNEERRTSRASDACMNQALYQATLTLFARLTKPNQNTDKVKRTTDEETASATTADLT